MEQEKEKENWTTWVFQIILGCIIVASIITLLFLSQIKPNLALVHENDGRDLKNETLTYYNRHIEIDSWQLNQFKGLPPPSTSLLCIGPAKTGTSTFLRRFNLYQDMESMGHEHEYLRNDCNSTYKLILSNKRRKNVWRIKFIESINYLFLSNESDKDEINLNKKSQTLHDTFIQFLFTSYPSCSLKGFQTEWKQNLDLLKKSNRDYSCINPAMTDRDDLLSEYQLSYIWKYMYHKTHVEYFIFYILYSIEVMVIIILIIIQVC